MPIRPREGSPIRRRKHGYILMMDRSDAGIVGTEDPSDTRSFYVAFFVRSPFLRDACSARRHG
eukprot:7297680-Pyramimonas_sp.AAC.1